MSLEPGGNGTRRPIREQVDGLPTFQIDTHRTVIAPFLPRPLVQADDAGWRDRDDRLRVEEAEHLSLQSLLVAIASEAVAKRNTEARQDVMDQWDERNRSSA